MTEKLIWYRGAPYLFDVAKCRRALVRREVEGALQNMSSLAVAARVSRSTASRFFSEHSVSLASSLRILKELGLEFSAVARPLLPEEVSSILSEPRHGLDRSVSAAETRPR